MSEESTTTLFMSWRNTRDNQLLWRAAVQRGWSIERVRGVVAPPAPLGRVLIYLESLFAPTLAARLGVTLSGVTENWLPRLPEEYRRRDVRLTTLKEIDDTTLPLFLKPPNEKSFAAQVYDDLAALRRDYEPQTAVLTATPVEWESEYRCFCLDKHVVTASPYLRHGRLSELDGFHATADELASAAKFAESVLRDPCVQTPSAIVLDVGTISRVGWAVVEANAAWGSGVYGCDPEKVLDVLEHATLTKDQATTTLYRPVGQQELDLIRASGWRRFPPRLPEQPIFYPVLTEAYATRIAREWNTRDANSGHVGYVLRFRVLSVYLDAFAVEEVGGRACQEYWIPAETLEAFNDHIVGLIELVAEYRPEGDSE